MAEGLENLRLPDDLDVEEQIREPAPAGTYIFTVKNITADTNTDDDGDEVRSYLIWNLTAYPEDNPKLDEPVDMMAFSDTWQSPEEQERNRQWRIRQAEERKGGPVDESAFGYPPPIIQTYRILAACGLMQRVKTGSEGGRANFTYEPIGWDKARDFHTVLVDRVPGCKIAAEVEITDRDGQRFNKVKRHTITEVVQS